MLIPQIAGNGGLSRTSMNGEPLSPGAVATQLSVFPLRFVLGNASVVWPPTTTSFATYGAVELGVSSSSS